MEGDKLVLPPPGPSPHESYSPASSIPANPPPEDRIWSKGAIVGALVLFGFIILGIIDDTEDSGRNCYIRHQTHLHHHQWDSSDSTDDFHGYIPPNQQYKITKRNENAQNGWWYRVSSSWSWTNDEETVHPTKLLGGGRDWLVNVEDRTIESKHNPSLVLGMDDSFPLVLVPRGSPDQLVFRTRPTDKGEFVPFTTDNGKEAVTCKEAADWFSHLSSRKAGVVSAEDADLTNSHVAYLDNFIYMNDDMVLDVAFWNIVEGNRVNFVKDRSKEDTFVSGGGRDWIWNDDGTIATMLNPSLVLGKQSPSMVLVEKNSPRKLLIEYAQQLADGDAVPMTLVSGGAVGKRYSKTKVFGPWHFIESAVSKEDEKIDAITIDYDGNFISLEGENLALDVSFWKIEAGVEVNFVGGETDHEIETKGLKIRDNDSYTSSSMDSSSMDLSSSSYSHIEDSADVEYSKGGDSHDVIQAMRTISVVLPSRKNT